MIYKGRFIRENGIKIRKATVSIALNGNRMVVNDTLEISFLKFYRLLFVHLIGLNYCKGRFCRLLIVLVIGSLVLPPILVDNRVHFCFESRACDLCKKIGMLNR